MEKKLMITIATAASRMARVWNNENISWTELCDRCRHSRTTTETMTQYLAMNRDEQTRIKDVGGFVGGFLSGGIRKNTAVQHRSIITLDVDFGTPDVWTRFRMAFPHTCAFLYSTHKHDGAKHCRFRLVVLLSRTVQPWEYEPIARRVAEKVGIDFFDGTTYELARLFFYPSTCKDAPFVFEEQEGQPLDADAILATYTDPHDASLWPHAGGESVRLHHEMKQLGDPRLKQGIIGAFCRAYPIEDAVALTEAYLPAAQPGRFTYKQGSVAGGMVTYSNLWAYSHHDTDPASRRLCNAFDLVRLHRFGHKDKDKTFADTTSAPSFKAMLKWAKTDPKTMAAMVDHNPTAASTASFDDKKEERQLELDKYGAIKSTATNIEILLNTDTNLKGRFFRNDFTGLDLATGSLPWKRDNGDGSTWNDTDFKNLQFYFDSTYGFFPDRQLDVALTHVFSNNRRHPVRDYLKAQQWDGQPRLDTLIADFLGAEPTPLNMAITRKMFVAAVARVMEPGIKFDHCLVLVGGEGIGKSTFLKKMGRQWFSDSLVTMEGKDAMEALRGVWIIELAELSGMKRSELEQQKQFLSKQVDRYREAYGRYSTDVPRQCVFFATTNEDTFLKGDTGNRRMWVIQIDARLRKHPGGVFDLTDDYIAQVYAEAYQAYLAHEPLYLEHDLEMESRLRQAEYNVEVDDPLPGMLDDFLRQPLPADWSTKTMADRRFFFQNLDPKNHTGTPRTKFCAAEFACEALGMNAKDRDFNYTIRKVNKLMKQKEGWEMKVLKIRFYGPQRGWEKVTLSSDEPEV